MVSIHEVFEAAHVLGALRAEVFQRSERRTFATIDLIEDRALICRVEARLPVRALSHELFDGVTKAHAHCRDRAGRESPLAFKVRQLPCDLERPRLDNVVGRRVLVRDVPELAERSDFSSGVRDHAGSLPEVLGVEGPDLGVTLVFARVPLRDRIEDGGVVRLVPEAAKHVLHSDDSVALVVDGPAAARQGEGTLAEGVAFCSRQASTRAGVALHTLRKLEVVLCAVAPTDTCLEGRASGLLPPHARGHEQVVRQLRCDRWVFDGEGHVRDRVGGTNTLRLDRHSLNLPICRPAGHLKDHLRTD